MGLGIKNKRAQRAEKIKPCVLCLHRLGFGAKRLSKMFKMSKKTSIMWFKDVPKPKINRIKVSDSYKAKSGFRELLEEEKQNRIAKRKEAAELRRIERQDPDVLRLKAREYYENNKHKILLRQRSNVIHRIRQAIRSRLHKKLSRNISDHRTVDLIGCSIPQFREYISTKFKPGMSWDIYGVWELDHIRPCSSFDLTDNDQILKCFHYSNYQPLWMTENRRKHAKYNL